MSLQRRKRRASHLETRRESFQRPLFLQSGSASANAQTTVTSEPCLVYLVSLAATSTTDVEAYLRDQNSTGDVREVLAVDGTSLRSDHIKYDWRAPLYMPEGIHITLSAGSSVGVCTVSYIELDRVPWMIGLDDYRTDFSFMARHAGGRIYRGAGGGGSVNGNKTSVDPGGDVSGQTGGLGLK